MCAASPCSALTGGGESPDALSGSGEVVTCNDQWPIPGNAGLSGRLLVERPVVDQPESLSGGDEVTVSARVELDNGTAVASADRTVTVAERDIPCADEPDG
ncbi:MAG: hypothetical protein V5A44_02285 [Haloarculaceae archaeon]